jgi:copper chaperone
MEENMEQVKLTVNGMTCAHCEKAVKNAMEDLNVDVIEVSASNNSLTVSFDPEKVSLDAIKGEIEDMDYTVV